MVNFIPLPDEKEWRTITYHPATFHTRMRDYHVLEYWQSVYGPNTRVEWNEEQDRIEKENFMGHLRADYPIIVIPDPDCVESYCEPLATMHKQFFDAASNLIYTLYPFGKGLRRSPKEKWRSPVHSALAKVYWDTTQWAKYTPDSWCSQLNDWLNWVTAYPVQSDNDVIALEKALVALRRHNQDEVTSV